MDQGGSKFDKYSAIEEEVLEKFKETREEFKIVHDFTLRKWALEAASKYRSPNFEFTASLRWLNNFKKRIGRYCISKNSETGQQETCTPVGGA